MVNAIDLETLLGNPNLQKVDREIAAKMDCVLYKDNMPILIGFMKKEIEASLLSIHDIELFITNHSDEVIDFGQVFLGKYKPQSLCIGIAITYAVYMIYLKEKTEKELLEYIKRRRIPQAKIFLEELLSVKKEMKW